MTIQYAEIFLSRKVLTGSLQRKKKGKFAYNRYNFKGTIHKNQVLGIDYKEALAIVYSI
jgi:hypothetical protein